MQENRVQEALARTLDQLKLQPGRYTIRGRVRLPDGESARWYTLNAVVRVPTKPWSGEDRRHGRPITHTDVRDAVRDALCDRIRWRVQKPWDGGDRRGPRQASLDEITRTLRADLQGLMSDLKIAKWDGQDRRAPANDVLLEAIRAELRSLPTAPSVTIDTRAIAREIARHLNRASPADHGEEPLVVEAPAERISIDDIQSMVDEILKRQR